jgi:hypothetical protein
MTAILAAIMLTAGLPAERGETLTFVRAARGGDVSYYGALRVSPSSG